MWYVMEKHSKQLDPKMFSFKQAQNRLYDLHNTCMYVCVCVYYLHVMQYYG